MRHAKNIIIALLVLLQLATGGKLIHFCPGEGGDHHSHDSAAHDLHMDESSHQSHRGHLHVGLGHSHHGHDHHESGNGDGETRIGDPSGSHKLADCAVLAAKLAKSDATFVLEQRDGKSDLRSDGAIAAVWLLALPAAPVSLVQLPRPPDRTSAQPHNRLRLALNSLLLL